jgi:hypothetical protein
LKIGIFGKFIHVQETWSFDYSTYIEATGLSVFLRTKSMELGIFLSYYYKKEGAVAENTTLKASPLVETSKSGNFILEFDLIFFNACLAIHEKEKSEMKIEFELDEKASQLILTGAYWPERGMDEI